MDEQMYMLGHEDICDETTRLTDHGSIEALGKHAPPIVVGEQWHASEARKRQLVAVPRFMKSTDGLPVAVHGVDVTPAGLDGPAPARGTITTVVMPYR